MKYTFHCAHCGTGALQTNHLPEPESVLTSTHWHNMDGSQVKKGTLFKCPSCSHPLIAATSFIRQSAVQSEERPQSCSSLDLRALASSHPSGSEGPTLPTSPLGA